MARRDGGAPSTGPSPERDRRPGQTWIVPALLGLLGAAALVFGRVTECLSLADSTPGSPGGEVCTTSMSPGAIIFALICFATAGFVWFVQRRR